MKTDDYTIHCIFVNLFTSHWTCLNCFNKLVQPLESQKKLMFVNLFKAHWKKAFQVLPENINIIWKILKTLMILCFILNSFNCKFTTSLSCASVAIWWLDFRLRYLESRSQFLGLLCLWQCFANNGRHQVASASSIGYNQEPTLALVTNLATRWCPLH